MSAEKIKWPMSEAERAAMSEEEERAIFFNPEHGALFEMGWEAARAFYLMDVEGDTDRYVSVVQHLVAEIVRRQKALDAIAGDDATE